MINFLNNIHNIIIEHFYFENILTSIFRVYNALWLEFWTYNYLYVIVPNLVYEGLKQGFFGIAPVKEEIDFFLSNNWFSLGYIQIIILWFFYKFQIVYFFINILKKLIIYFGNVYSSIFCFDNVFSSEISFFNSVKYFLIENIFVVNFFSVNLSFLFIGLKLFTLLCLSKYLIFFFFYLIFDRSVLNYKLISKLNNQQFFEFIVVSFQKVVKQNFGHGYPYKGYLICLYPLFFIVFFLILIANFLGLIPFGIL